MSDQKISKLLNSVINEDAIEFKNSLSKILYEKVNNRLKQEYINVSKNLFENTTLAVGTGMTPQSQTGLQAYSPSGPSQNSQQSMFNNQNPSSDKVLAVGGTAPQFSPLAFDDDIEFDQMSPEEQLRVIREMLRWMLNLSPEQRKEWQKTRNYKKWWKRFEQWERSNNQPTS
jgi:hypothetical protein